MSGNGPRAMRGWRSRSCLLLLLATAEPATALDFAGGDLEYREDFVGETSYPLTPEVDTASVGGGFGGDAPPSGGSPALTGTAARVVVNPPGTTVEFVGFAPGTFAAADFGARARFEGLALTGDGAHDAGIGALSLTSNTSLGAGVEVSRLLSTNAATLQLIERDDLTLTDVNAAYIPLSTAEATALLAGAAFTIDMFLDAGASALATIEVDGFAPTSASIAISQLGTLANIFVSGFSDDVLPAAAQIDITNVELYSALARSFNFDVGASGTTPSAAYAAAGPAGHWNTVHLFTSASLDTDGNYSGVTVSLTALVAGGVHTGGPPDPQALLGDAVISCGLNPDTWTLRFEGLPDGDYRVLLYAPAHPDVDSGAMTINLAPLANLTGDPGFGLTQGVAWDEIVTTTTAGGVIEIVGTEASATLCVGIAGAQIVPYSAPAKVPGLAWPGLALLAALAAGAGIRSTRQQ